MTKRGAAVDQDIVRWLCVALAKATSGWPVHLTPGELADAIDLTFEATEDGGVDITVLAGAEAEANFDVDTEPDPAPDPDVSDESDVDADGAG